MSLDVYLTRKRWISYDGGKTHSEDEEEVFWANITHNVSKMADEAGIRDELWCPEENNITKANQLIEPLTKGLADLKARPEYFEQFNASNGWGLYVHFVPFVEEYLNACISYPDANVRASR